MISAVGTLSAGEAAVPSVAAIPEDAVLGSIATFWEQEHITPILDLEAGLLKVRSLTIITLRLLLIKKTSQIQLCFQCADLACEDKAVKPASLPSTGR